MYNLKIKLKVENVIYNSEYRYVERNNNFYKNCVVNQKMILIVGLTKCLINIK